MSFAMCPWVDKIRTQTTYAPLILALPLSLLCTLQELKVLRCRNCQLKKINPQLYNLLPLLSELDLGRNEVCVATLRRSAPDIFQLFLMLAPFLLQFKFLDKDEFRDVKRLTKVLLDGNQLSVVVDQLFRMQKSLNHLGELLKLPAAIYSSSFCLRPHWLARFAFVLQIYLTIVWPKCQTIHFYSWPI